MPVIAWLAAGAVTAAGDGFMVWRRYSGRLGAQVRAECDAAVRAAGGPRRAAAALMLRDFAIPPAGLALCAVRYLRDRSRP
jgi:hypothetical protein